MSHDNGPSAGTPERMSASVVGSPEERRAETAPATLLYLIKQVELAVRARLDELTSEHGLTTVQYTAMTVLARHPDMTVAELARNSFVRAQTMAQVVAGLEQNGLVRRRPDPASRRRVLVSLASDGDAVLARLREPVERLEAEMVDTLGAGEIADLGRLLRSCRVGLSGTHPR